MMEALAQKPIQASVEDQFLDWFTARGFPLIEEKLEFGGLKFYQFQAQFKVSDGRNCTAFGSDSNRRTALLKCASEAIEREVMVDYFSKQGQIPKAFRNSNGWAVHLDPTLAKASAMNEALERHLLLKSFFAFGWDGFKFYQKISFDETSVLLLTSRFVYQGKVAGFVVSKSPKFQGVAFGYCFGKKSDLDKTSFWQGGIFESLSKILFTGDHAHNPDAWIEENISYFLNSYFDISKLESLPKCEVFECKSKPPEVELIDLQQKLDLEFPLFAARAFGVETLPLFSKSRLDESAIKFIEPILIANGIKEIPERHPIL